MEEAGLSLDAGSMDQLDQDFELELNAEGFDFQIDGTYDQTDELAANTAIITENTTSKPDSDEIGYEDDDDLGIENDHQQHTEAGEGTVSEETGQENVDDEPEQDTNGDHTGELDLNFEFDEEIGYEDDGVAAAYVSPDSNSPEAAQPAVEQTSSLAEGQLESEHDSRSTSEAEMTTAEDADAHQDVDVEIEDYEEHESQHDKSSDEGEEGGPNLDNRSDIEADESTDENDHEQSILGHDENPDSGPSEADKAIQDLANSLPGTPEIEVLYNDVTYMLFGSSDDDPESYFLADTKELDRPLSQFLAAVRQIISNEILPSDVLLISFDSLDLEFGERSNERFLGRTLRELLDCYAALAARNDDIPPTPVLQLIVQHDCEERFLQLRHDAGLRETQSHHTKESDEAENQDSWRSVDDQGDEGDEFTDSLDQIERRVASDDVDNAATPNIVANMAPQDGDESDMSTADGHDSTGETQATDSRYVSAAPASPTPAAADDLDDENQMEEEDHFAHHENGESTAIEVDNPATTPQEVISSEIYEYTTEQPSIDLINGGFVEDAGFETLDEIVVANGDGVEQITGINGDDVLHAYDDGAELSMILEQEDHAEEEIVVATDAEVNIIHDDGDEELVLREDWHRDASGVSQSATPAASNLFQNATYVAAATDSGSVHTSTTINGDEIDYDEYNPTDGSFNSGDDGQPLTAADGGENDEIDWENDGDEDDDDQVATDEHSAPQKQQEPSLTPSSLAGKRIRTDEVESLPEGSDHKRRRT